MKQQIMVTGGCGFIGSNFINYVLKSNNNVKIINVDILSYCSSLSNINHNLINNSNYLFIEADINNTALMQHIIDTNNITLLINFAAESHVDNSIKNSTPFIISNINGVHSLLTACKAVWYNDANEIWKENVLFHQISTDEVYGELQLDNKQLFTEQSNLKPRSPYSASKAAADLLVQSFNATYKMPVLITRCANNFGPNQYAEKLIPVVIGNYLNNKQIPVYGDGLNIRDWLYVDDHIQILLFLQKIYYQQLQTQFIVNISTCNEINNIDLVNFIQSYLNNKYNQTRALVEYVKDRAGHDRRYGLNADFLYKKLNYQNQSSQQQFRDQLEMIIDLYCQ